MTATEQAARPQHLVHEFNNLVFLLTAYTDEMIERMPTDHPLAHDLQTVANASRRLAALSWKIRSLEQSVISSVQTRARTDLDGLVAHPRATL